MNTKILSILMMLVIAAHVVSTSAVIASEKKRLQSQSASAQTDDVVPEFGIDANTQFTTVDKNQLAQKTINNHGQTVDLQVLQEKPAYEKAKTEVLAYEKAQREEKALAFKEFERIKEKAAYTARQKVCLQIGGCAQDFLEQITRLSKECIANFPLEDLQSKINDSPYTLEKSSIYQSLSTTEVSDIEGGQLDSEGNHNLHKLGGNAGWENIQTLLSDIFNGVNLDPDTTEPRTNFATWFKIQNDDPEAGKDWEPSMGNPINHEQFFLMLKQFVGIEMQYQRPLLREGKIAMNLSWSCIIDDSNGNGCFNEVVFSTWRCGLVEMEFNQAMVKAANTPAL